MEYIVYYGSKNTLEDIANRKVKALNRRTMKYQIVDRTANYEIKQYKNELYELSSNIDIKSICKNKNLIL